MAKSGLHVVARPNARTLLAMRNAQMMVSTPVASVATLTNSCNELTGTMASSNSDRLMLPARKSAASFARPADRIADTKVPSATTTVEMTIGMASPPTRRTAAAGVGWLA